LVEREFVRVLYYLACVNVDFWFFNHWIDLKVIICWLREIDKN
jgi:hypothetical protein